MQTRRTTEFELLAGENLDAVYTKAIRITRSMPKAEALVQSAFSQAYSAFDSYDHTVGFKEWLFQIMESHSKKCQ